MKRLFGWQWAQPEPVASASASGLPAREPRDSLFAEAAAQFHAGNPGRAAALHEQCVELAHDDAEAHSNLGIARHRLGMQHRWESGRLLSPSY